MCTVIKTTTKITKKVEYHITSFPDQNQTAEQQQVPLTNCVQHCESVIEILTNGNRYVYIAKHNNYILGVNYNNS